MPGLAGIDQRHRAPSQLGLHRRFDFLRFLQRLVRSAERKIFLIVDNLRPHRVRIVTAWVAANSDKIELVYLPPYAPEQPG